MSWTRYTKWFCHLTNSSSSERCHYLLKFTTSLAFNLIKTLVWGGCPSCQGLTTATKKCQSTLWKGSEKQKYSSWNFEIIKIFFCKRRLKKAFLFKTENQQQKCQFTNFLSDLQQNSRPVCYFNLKTGIKCSSFFVSKFLWWEEIWEDWGKKI